MKTVDVTPAAPVLIKLLSLVRPVGKIQAALPSCCAIYASRGLKCPECTPVKQSVKISKHYD